MQPRDPEQTDALKDGHCDYFSGPSPTASSYLVQRAVKGICPGHMAPGRYQDDSILSSLANTRINTSMAMNASSEMFLNATLIEREINTSNNQRRNQCKERKSHIDRPCSPPRVQIITMWNRRRDRIEELRSCRVMGDFVGNENLRRSRSKIVRSILTLTGAAG